MPELELTVPDEDCTVDDELLDALDALAADDVELVVEVVLAVVVPRIV